MRVRLRDRMRANQKRVRVRVYSVEIVLDIWKELTNGFPAFFKP